MTIRLCHAGLRVAPAADFWLWNGDRLIRALLGISTDLVQRLSEGISSRLITIHPVDLDLREGYAIRIERIAFRELVFHILETLAVAYREVVPGELAQARVVLCRYVDRFLRQEIAPGQKQKQS